MTMRSRKILWCHWVAVGFQVVGSLFIFLEAQRIGAQLHSIDASYGRGPPPGYDHWFYFAGPLGFGLLLLGILLAGITLSLESRAEAYSSHAGALDTKITPTRTFQKKYRAGLEELGQNRLPQVISSAQSALKAAVLVNGGGAIALLAFFGQAMSLAISHACNSVARRRYVPVFFGYCNGGDCNRPVLLGATCILHAR
jgi:hypothetical protein